MSNLNSGVHTTDAEWEIVYKERPSVFEAIHKAMAEHAKTNPISNLDVLTSAQYLLADMGCPYKICNEEGLPIFDEIPSMLQQQAH